MNTYEVIRFKMFYDVERKMNKLPATESTDANGEALGASPEYAEYLRQITEARDRLITEIAKLSPEQQAQFFALREKMARFEDGAPLNA